MNDGRIVGLSAFLSDRHALLGALLIVLLGPTCVPVGRVGDRSSPPSDLPPDLAPIPLQDDMGLAELETDFAATNARLERAIGDLAAVYSICENIPQDRPASRCWTKASQLNPDLRDEICGRMLDHIDDPYEEECRLGVVWPLER